MRLWGVDYVSIRRLRIIDSSLCFPIVVTPKWAKRRDEDSLPKSATMTTTTMMAINPPLLMLKEAPEPEAPALVSIAVPESALPSELLEVDVLAATAESPVDVTRTGRDVAGGCVLAFSVACVG